MTKSVFRSKTMLVNTLAIGVALFQHFVVAIPAADPQWYGLAVAVINIGLRFTTTQPVTLR